MSLPPLCAEESNVQVLVDYMRKQGLCKHRCQFLSLFRSRKAESNLSLLGVKQQHLNF
jgi:hypothetical protein